MLDGVVVGALRLLLPLRDNPSMAVVDLAVDPAARRRGVGTALLDEPVRLARRRGRTELITEVDEPRSDAPGRRFALRHGWSCDLVETRRDLALPLDEPRLRPVEDGARRASSAYELVTWRDRTPDELLDDRALLERRMTTDAPSGDCPWRRRTGTPTGPASTRGCTPSAPGPCCRPEPSETAGSWPAPTSTCRRAPPSERTRGGTLVLREHRGHRLGSLVKAAVLRQLASGVPQVRTITTFSSDSNAPMAAVNEALGFVPAGSLSSWSVRV